MSEVLTAEQIAHKRGELFYGQILCDSHEALRAERDRLQAELDPPVCRLQFPDGSVPGNAREAAEGWHQHCDRASDERNDLREDLTAARQIIHRLLQNGTGGEWPQKSADEWDAACAAAEDFINA